MVRNALIAVVDYFEMIKSASNVAWAVEGNRRPDPADLRRLGIDPVNFHRVQMGGAAA